MVRNATSMQNLRGNMADMNLNPVPTPSTQNPPQRLQTLNTRPYTQLFGNDPQTKAISNRIATGTATESDYAHFDRHVNEMGGRPSDSRPPWCPPANSPSCEELGVDPYNVHAQQDYQLQLMLLEQENKRRIRAGEPLIRTSASQKQHQPVAPSQTRLPTYSDHALQDHEMQLMLLEQQNKKRLLMARSEQDNRAGGVMEQPNAVKPSFQIPQMDSKIPTSTKTEPRQESKQEDHLQEDYQRQLMQLEAANKRRLRAERREAGPEFFCTPFCEFLTDNPTVFHAVHSTKKKLKAEGWTELSERDAWDIKTSGRYFVERNGSSLIAFAVGSEYEPGNGAAILAGHVDAITAKLKPVSEVPNQAGYLQLGVAPYAGGMNETWWDRDLGIGGRVLIEKDDKIVTKLVKLDWPIARIPTLAPHFGAAAQGPFNRETQMTPIIGLEGSEGDEFQSSPIQGPMTNGSKSGLNNFIKKQPPALVRAIGTELGLSEQSYHKIVNWELELFDLQPATRGGLNKEFIYAGRIDDKLCSWAAMEALTDESTMQDSDKSSIIKVVSWFDDEEIGSGLRQGARSNFLPQVLERAVGSLAKHHPSSDLMGRTYANSFIVSSDVTHAVNPNFLNAYLGSHSPRLNTGLVVAADANGHMTTDAVSTALLHRCAERVDAKLQVFQIRNDSRSGGTVGPMLSSMTGIRAIDAGMPQLSMHSIRATTGALDPGLGVLAFKGFLNGFEEVDKEFRG